MPATKGHRSWGWVRRLPSGRYQASYQHAGSRHYAAVTFTAKMMAEGWIAQERQAIERGDWTSPSDRRERLESTRAGKVLTLADYARGDTKRNRMFPLTSRSSASITEFIVVLT